MGAGVGGDWGPGLRSRRPTVRVRPGGARGSCPPRRGRGPPGRQARRPGGALATPRLTSARPCRALLLLQPAGGFVPAPPSPAPAPREPVPCGLYRRRRRADSRLSGTREFFGSRARAREQASSKGGVGVGREREQVRAVASRSSARQQLGTPFWQNHRNLERWFNKKTGDDPPFSIVRGRGAARLCGVTGSHVAHHMFKHFPFGEPRYF